MRFNYLCLPLMAMCILPAAYASAQQSPARQMPDSWLISDGYSQHSPTDSRWWESFGDATLDSLITLGEQNNYDLAAAVHRIEMAQQGLRQARAQYYPTISASAGWTAQRASGMTTAHDSPATNMNYFNIGANLSWEIDVFGKVKARAEQSKAAVTYSRLQRDAMMVSLASNIASAYMQLRTLQAQLDVLNKHIDQQKKVTDITQARHEAGLASMLDVSQSLTTYYSTLANETSINTSIASTINSLAVLTGTYPSDITAWLSTPAPLPDYRRIVAVGVPMDVLRQRADVAEAEALIDQYAAAVGVAKKDYLPSLTLNGSVGTTAHSIGDIADSRSLTYSVAPAISWTIFDGHARSAAEASAREQMMAAVDSYNSTVLTAVQEVENAMTTYRNALAYIDTIEQVTQEADKTYRLSIDLYKQGLTPFINVTTAQITYLQYSNELESARGNALSALVNLYNALGGGWQQ